MWQQRVISSNMQVVDECNHVARFGMRFEGNPFGGILLWLLGDKHTHTHPFRQVEQGHKRIAFLIRNDRREEVCWEFGQFWFWFGEFLGQVVCAPYTQQQRHGANERNDRKISCETKGEGKRELKNLKGLWTATIPNASRLSSASCSPDLSAASAMVCCEGR